MKSADQPLVLIVDDNDRNRRLAGDLLRLAAFRTIEAATGAEAIALALDHLPNVILMDLYLPDISGIQAALMIRSDARTSVIPVVVLTALPIDASDDWFPNAGFAGYIRKPIDVDTFSYLVRSFLVQPQE